jgi:hypothetical protein
MEKNELFRNLNEGIVAERMRAFRANLRKNLPYIRRFGGLERVVGLLSGKHVVIVGAGPSLGEGLRVLKKYGNRRELAVIAADMALRPLVKRGIRPSFVISCEATPAGFFDGIETASMHLLAFSCMAHSTLRTWNGDISFYNWMLRGEPYDGLWREAGEGLGFVATGSIVTTQAVSLVLGCPVTTLALAGNDLAFYRSFYLRGTLRHARYLETCERFAAVETMESAAIRRAREYVIDRNGSTCFTNGQFLAAKMWLEDLLPRQRLPIIDSSEPGCSERAVRKARLEEHLRLLDRGRRK